jgi:hypothetical protein
MTLAAFLNKLERVTKSGAGHMARCPAHEDRTASLSVREGDDGKILLFCQAGCETKRVLEKLSLTFADISGHRNGASPEKHPPRIVDTYDYTDEHNAVLYQVVRYEPKDFRQRRPDGKGGWIWDTENVRRVLYRLPAVITASHVLVVEGEKDVNYAAAKLNLVATCNAAGACKWTEEEYSEPLRGKDVTIIPDNDEPGRKHAEQVARSLAGKAASVAICKLPEPCKDLSEWPLSKESLLELIKAAPAWSPDREQTPARRLERYSVADIFAAKETKVDFKAWPLLAVGLSSILDGLPKLAGKTRFYLEAIKASRDKRVFLGHATAPMRVVYVSEQSTASLGMQMREVGFTGHEPMEELMIVPREEWCRFTYTQMLAEVEELYLAHGDYNVLIFDTWHTISRLEDENQAAEVNRIGNLTLDLAARHKLALSMSRHDRKSGGDVGVSGRSSLQLSGLVDVILHLLRVPGKSPNVRKLQTLARVPGLPAETLIELVGNSYVNHGEETPVQSRVEMVKQWLTADPDLTAIAIVGKFAAQGIDIGVTTAKRYRTEAQL